MTDKKEIIEKEYFGDLSKHILEDEIDQKTGLIYDGIDVQWVKEFIKRRDELRDKYIIGEITMDEFVLGCLELAGRKLTK